MPQDCFYCRTHDGCALKDYLQPMYEAIKEADAIVFSSPIYYYQNTTFFPSVYLHQ